MSIEDQGIDERELMAAVARRFYIEDRSKVEIATELKLSRFKVARLLDQARSSGLVTITLDDAGLPDRELSERLRRHLDLTECLVVESAGDEADVRRQIGAAAATLLASSLHEGDVLGLAWGRTTAAMTAELKSLPKISIVQLTGTVGGDLAESPVEIVRQASQRAGGTAKPIFAPFLLDDPVTTAALRRQADVAEVMDMFGSVTVAVVAVGSWDPPASRLREALSDVDRRSMEDQGTQAEVAAIFIDRDGRVVGQQLTDRCLSINATQLAAIPRVIAVAGGRAKARAVLAVARARLITSLITDRALAEAVLDIPYDTEPIEVGEP
ncbi:sugar-binding transcriptional regulator [Nakamurella deserti]|uniref:sugar-binding transcriptional regulator n=1 Tax=Nakamurella deserti TaxID=2164074 RepID=UPI00130073E0|nr:sugar-binding domain-containing protein [Nakamurella deserti]